MKRNIFITGASSGIGKAIAYAFGKNGDNLVLCARRLEKLEEIKKDIESKYDVKVDIYKLDVTVYEEVVSVVKEAVNRNIHIDVLINNAGLALGLDKFQDYSISDMEIMLNTNVKGLLYVTREIIPNMISQNSGHIINIGSTAGMYSYANGAVYCATKVAVRFLSDGIRIDTIDKNIKVTTIQPGIVETDFSEVRFYGDKEKAGNVYKGVEALKPEDIADIVLYSANQPKHVQISDITIMATKQATGFNVHRE
ncbi:SDR family NAD(P)-dependent oxidoreductase [Pseudoleptotrichia goodfellowii]|jgi:NADP-dependent l-serine/l-allo-threonine dehydrogenase ydfg|uniref:Oxidoreductase, short chain dehydrogenase/reductase family protein n=1 Tax=Pseudoleptotrichia goodfellowii F0264 TaxID=596323 RepID=D0GLD9_9FUSO|nr:SDR family NAD(P)-dependent oxidoreductase [Pseudoleptotrichia goodfellowii]EEY35097.1 oxidoreductase, short chain dehydrogenase/reductase family protein [Pseudoleptotrichia goodfellowii F0264]MBF4806312.1 SDR family NAD(P)-dependent oxidoreductase [Pseudoleptotrichia goodfellowii]